MSSGNPNERSATRVVGSRMNIKDYNKSRLDLEEGENSNDYWDHACNLIRGWRYHAKSKHWYEKKLRHVLKGTGLSMDHMNLDISDISQYSSIHSDE